MLSSLRLIMQVALNRSVSIVSARSTCTGWLTQKTSYTFSGIVNKKRKKVITKEGVIGLPLFSFFFLYFIARHLQRLGVYHLMCYRRSKDALSYLSVYIAQLFLFCFWVCQNFWYSAQHFLTITLKQFRFPLASDLTELLVVIHIAPCQTELVLWLVCRFTDYGSVIITVKGIKWLTPETS